MIFKQFIFSCIKRLLALALLFTISFSAKAANETLTTGSFIINMGVLPQTAGNALKPYGMIYDLIKNYGVSIRWVISQTKRKDGTDFVYNGVQYKGGTFILPAEFRNAAVNARITYWQGQGVVGATSTTPLTVDVSVNLYAAPRWVLDAANGSIAAAFLTAAGVPTTAYIWKTPAQLDCCDDLFVMPHADPTWATHGNLYNWNKTCIGGIWAGCHAVSVMESLVNPSNPAQSLNFLSTNKLLPFGSHSGGSVPYSNYWQNGAAQPSLASDPVFQMMGSEDAAHLNGSEQIYMPDKSRGSVWRATTKIGTYDSTQLNVPSVGNFPASVTVYGRGFGDSTRGWVMYESGHDIGGTTAANIAAQREFFNWSFLAALDKVPFLNTYINVPTHITSNALYPGLHAFGGTPVANYPLKYLWVCTAGGTFASAFGTNGTANDSITTFTAPAVAVVTPAFIYCKITDACGRSVTKTQSVTLYPPEVPPVAVNDTISISGLCGATGPQTINVLTNDYDLNGNMQSSITLLNNGTAGTFVNNGSGSVTYNPGINFAGSDTARYRVCDDSSNCVTALIVVRVTGSGACSLTQYQQSNTAYADSVILAASITNPTFALSAPNFTQGNNGTAAKFNALTDSLVLRLTQTLQSGDTVKIWAASDNNNCVSFSVAGGLTSTSFGAAQNLQTPGGAGGNKQFAAYNFIATASNKYIKIKIRSSACDVKLDVDAVEYNYKICVSAIPIANADAATTGKNTSLMIPVKINDSDPQGQTLTYSIMSSPANGSAQIKPTGILYNPSVGYTGNDSLIYKACNTNCLCDTANVRITINNTSCASNQIGTFKAGNATAVTAQNSITNATKALGAPDEADNGNTNTAQFNATTDSLVLDLSDTIPSGDTVIIRWASDNASVANIVLTSSLNNSTYSNSVNLSTPGGPAGNKVFQNNNYVMTADARYIKIKWLSGGNGDVDALSYSFQACTAIPNRPPIALDDTSTTYVNTGVSRNVVTNDIDPDGNTLTASLITTSTSKGTATILNNVITYTPNSGVIGVDTIFYKSCDNGSPSLCDTAMYIITILPSPPIANKDTISTQSGNAVTVNVQSNDSKPVNTYTYTTSLRSDILPAGNGTAALVGNNIQYTPAAGFTGVDSFAYQICDNQSPSACDTAIVYVTVINRPPVTHSDTVTTGTCNSITINATSNDTDPENGILTITSVVVNTPSAGTATITGNKVIFTPSSSPVFQGNASITYTVCDNGTPQQCVSSIGNIIVHVNTVAPPNAAPVALNDIDSTYANQVLYLDVLGNDSDPDLDDIAIDTTASGLLSPAKGSIQYLPNGLIIYTPNAALATGRDSFDYKVCDIHPQNAGGCVNIPVNCATSRVYITFQNRPPVANDDATSTTPVAPVSGSVAYNDIEPDGQPMTFSKISGPSHGAISFNAAGSYTYTPNGVYLGNDTVTYKVCDNGMPSLCDTAILVITIANGPLPPNPQPDTITTYSGTPVSGTVANNDSDPNGNLNPNSFTMITGPSFGNIIFNPDGSYTYTSDSTFTGIDVINYEVCDSTGLCGTSSLTITVLDAAPLAIWDIASVNEDSFVVIAVLSNDNFGGNGPSANAINITDNANHGVSTVNNNGTPNDPTDDKINYTPAANYNGFDTLIYQICDADGDCDTAIVYITINPVNDVPVANADIANVNEDENVSIPVLINDDFGGDGPSIGAITIISDPLNGSDAVDDNGTPLDPTDDKIVYFPNGDYNGRDSLIYQICDADGDCDTAIVYINVISVDDFPNADADEASVNEDDVVTIPVLANDNFGGDGPSSAPIFITDNANHGFALVDNNGTPGDPTDDQIIYIPSLNYNGNDTLIYEICDFDGDCDTAIVFITIIPQNDPPFIPDTTVTTLEDSSVTVCLQITDPDAGDSFSASLCGGPFNGINAGSTVSGNTFCITYTPNINWNGTDSICVIICDAAGACDTALIQIIVTPVDNFPLANRDIVNLNEDANVMISVLANDDFGGDGASVGAIAITGSPANGIASVNDGGTPNDPTDDKIFYTPNADFNGSDTLIYEICDIDNDCDTAIVYINVFSVNDKPVAVDDSGTTNEDTPLTLNVAANDFDVDGNLIINSVNIISIPPGSEGTVINNGDGTITFIPSLNFNGIVTPFNYKICDNSGSCDTATVFITVIPVNDPPIANDDFATVDPPGFGLPDTIAATKVTINDYDPDGTPLSISFCGGPNKGSASISNDTIFYKYTGPIIDLPYTDTICYIACDPGSPVLCDTALLLIFTPFSELPPTATDDHATTNEDVPVMIDVQVNDYDPNGDSFTTSVLTNPSHGTVNVLNGDSILYTPDPDFNGLDTFMYFICDTTSPVALCDTATVFIIVFGVNDPPVAIDDSVTINEDTPVTLSVTNNDTDKDGDLDTTSIVLLSSPPVTEGTVVNNGNGTVTFIPTLNFNGVVTPFSYQVCDHGGLCDTAVVYIFVLPVNDPPVVPDTIVTIPEDSAITVCLPITDVDSGDNWSASLCGGPFNGAFTDPTVFGTNVCITYTPNANWNGRDSICIITCDTSNACDTSLIRIIVSSVDDFPLAIADYAVVDEDTSVTIPVLINDDFGGDGPVVGPIEITVDPLHGTATVDDGGTPNDPTDDQIIYTPTPNYNGVDTLIYQICDDDEDCDTAIVYITVNPVNDPPFVPDTIIITLVNTPVSVCIPITDIDSVDSWTTTICGGLFHGTLTSGPTVIGRQVCLTYLPAINYHGADTICLITCDSGGLCDTSQVFIDVNCVNTSQTIDSSICQGESVTVGGQTFNTTGTNAVVIPNSQGCDSTITLNLVVRPTTSFTIDSSICQADSVIVGGQTFNTTGTHVVVIPNSQFCDSTITLNLIVRPTTSLTIDSSICQGDSVTVGGQTFNTTGTHVVVIPNSQSCDSTITLNLIVRSTTSQTIDSSICSGDSVIVGGQTFNSTGTFAVVIPNAQSCDSTITLNLVVRPTTSQTIDSSICSGDSVIVGGQTFNITGTHVVVIPNSQSCDSTITLNLIVRQTTSFTIDSSICQGGSVTVGGQTFNTTGTHVVVIPNSESCDSMITLNLIVRSSSSIIIDSSICSGDSITVGGQTFDSTGTFVVVIPNSQNCDSAIILNLIVRSTTSSTIDSSICQGDSVIVGGQTFNTTGAHIVVIPNAQSCDSTITLNLFVKSTTSQTVDSSICQGDSVTVGGQTFNSTGTFTVVIPNSQSCDSTITLNLIVKATTSQTVDSSICQGDSVIVGGQTFNSTGTFTVVIPNSQSCDSTITLNLIVKTTTSQTVDSSICQGDSVIVGGQTFNSTGTFTFVIPNAQSCDSTITLNLVVRPTTSSTIDSSICQGDSVIVGGQTFNSTGTHVIVIPNSQSCDSTIMLNLIVRATTSSTIDSSICQGGSVTVGGQTFNTTGTYVVEIPNSESCDSTITLNLVVRSSSSIIIDSSICRGDSVIVGGQTFDSTGTFVVVIPNSQNCDSAIILNLIVRSTISSTIDSSICSGDSVVIGGQIFNTTGTYVVVIPSLQSCDSTITLNLIVRATTSQTIDISICQGDSVTVGGQIFNSTGTHVVVIPNSQSCDSTITLNLIVRSTTSQTIDSSICSGDSVIVGGQTFNTTGTHVVVISNAQSCDSTITLNLIVRATTSQTIDSSICSGDSVIVGGQTFNTTGTHVVVISNAQSCDSTITLNLIVRPTTSQTIDSSICSGDSVTIGGQVFNTTGTHVVVIPNSQSCDSTITLNLIVRPTTSQTVDSSICSGDSVIVGGQTFNTTGTHVVVIPNSQSCDSTITLNLIVRSTTSQTIDSSICSGDSVIVGGQTFNTTGTHVVVISNVQSCDSTITLNLIVRATTSQTIDSSICSGDSVIVGGQTFNSTGTHVVVIPNSQSCDSTITLNLIVRATTSQTIDSSICSGDSVIVGGQTFNSTGMHVVVIPNAQSCDSTITLNLVVRQTTSQTIDSSICQGDSVTVGGQIFNSTGTHVVVIPNSQSCDSTITLNLIVRPTTSQTIDSSICQGDSVAVGGQTFNTTGTHVVVIPNSQSCDSTITLNLIVRPTTSQTIDSSICQGDSVAVGGQTFNTTGTHVVVIPNSQSCDSTITLNLIVRPTTSQTIDSSICSGDSIMVGGQTFNTTGTHVVVIPNTQSCDSTITLNLIVKATSSQTVDSSICSGDSVTVGGQTFNSTGTFTVVIPNAQSCDSTITLNLVVRQTTSQTIDSSICSGDSVTIGGQVFNTTGTHVVVIPNSQSCDSTITLNLVVRQTTSQTIDSSICQGDSVTIGGQTFNTTGAHIVVIPNAQSCDSTITLNLIVRPITSFTIDSSICSGDGVTVGGQTFNTNGTHVVVIPNSQSCDSTITLNLIVRPKTSFTIDSSICSGDSVTVGGQTFNTTGTHVVVIPNSQSCDSTITLNLIVRPKTSFTIDSSICSGNSVTVGGQTFNTTGTHVVVIPNSQSCDSTITLNLVVRATTSQTIDSSICSGDSVTIGGQIFNTTGTHVVVIPNTQSCDSTITLNLIVREITSKIIFSSICQGDSVTIGGQTFNTTGTHVVVIPNSQGCDSTITLNLIVIATGFLTIDSSICSGDSVTVGGQTFNTNGTHVVVIPNSQSCDSTITLNLIVRPITSFTIDSSICSGDSVTVGGQTFNTNGTHVVVIPNSQSCDSTITLNLIVRPKTSFTIDSSICSGDSVIVGGQTFNTTGIHVVVIPNSQSCDSTITLNLIVRPKTSFTIDSSICQGTGVTIGGQTFNTTGTHIVIIPNSQSCDSIITLNLSVQNCLIIDTLRDVRAVLTTATICNIPKPAGPVINVTACDGSTAGTAMHGTWTIVDSCLIYIAGHSKGMDTLCIKACDIQPLPLCIQTTIIITVIGLPPLAVNDTVKTEPNTTVTINVMHNDSTYDSDPLMLCYPQAIIVQPDHGTTVANGDGTITYTPVSGYTGLDSFQYELCDPEGPDSAWVLISIGGCEIPNAFSPNGDGINDVFKIPCAHTGDVFFDVFNRWGIEVYRNNNYMSDWDGKYEGSPLPDGTYYYLLKYIADNGESVNKAGFITLHR